MFTKVNAVKPALLIAVLVERQANGCLQWFREMSGAVSATRSGSNMKNLIWIFMFGLTTTACIHKQASSDSPDLSPDLLLPESADGTTIPNASQIVDSNGTIWTVHDGDSDENGVPDGGSDISELLYLNMTIYANTNSNGWWTHGDSGWSPTSDPSSGGSSESASGTTIPDATQIVDSNGTVWTVSSGFSYENGVADGGANITELLYYEGMIYANTNSYGWWIHTNGGWSPTSDPIGSGGGGTGQLGGCGSCDEHQDGIDVLQTLINRPVDYILVWGWAQTPGDLMYAFHYLESEFPTGTLHYDVPMIISGHTFADGYDGSDDATYLDVAQTIASRDPNGIIRIGHEMNGGYDYQMNGPAGTSAEFVLCYQHLVQLFRSVSPGFTFVWNPGAGMSGGDFLPTYPGDDYVDYVSFDIYEDAWLATSFDSTDRWNYFLDDGGRGLNWLSDFAIQHNKLIAFDEWGSATDDGFFITNMYNWMQAHSDRMGYQMYWDSDSGFPGSFATHPVNAATFKQLFGQ
jgi:hypothetical protein